MKLILETFDIQAYLRCTDILDYDHPTLQQLKHDLAQAGQDGLETARTLYEYVRDNIAHSTDIDASTVTCTASDVLAAGHGICCSKSHLLAALLRANEIPAGICYQKLRTDEDDPESDLILHCLNAIYLHSLDKWIRVDARGNKANGSNSRVDAQFSTGNEQLAWPVRRELGEGEDLVIYANPWPEVVYALQTSRTRTELYTVLQTLWTPEITARFQ
jgi:transglutaminase-like putative cysteine protease